MMNQAEEVHYDNTPMTPSQIKAMRDEQERAHARSIQLNNIVKRGIYILSPMKFIKKRRPTFFMEGKEMQSPELKLARELADKGDGRGVQQLAQKIYAEDNKIASS
jgi:hypothetical protein